MKRLELKERKVDTVATQVCEGEEQQPWYKCAGKDVELNAETLGVGKWIYDLELEHLIDKVDGRIESNVPLLMYLMKNYGDTSEVLMKKD